MTVTEQPTGDTETPAAKPKTKPVPEATTGPTVRTWLSGAGVIGAIVAGVVLFVSGGWLFLAGGAAVGVAGTAVVAKARSTRPHKTRPGLVQSWLTRTRRTASGRASKGAGSLPWSLTGNQSKRARTGHGPGVRRQGSRGLMPGVTAKGRARRAALAASGKAPAKTTPGARPVGRKPAAKRPAGPGKSHGRTPTKTPASPSTRSRLTPSTKPAAKAGNATARPRLAAAKRTPARQPVSNGGKGAKVIPFKRPAKSGTSVSPLRRTGGVSARRNGAGRGVAATRRNPLRPTGGAARLGRRTGNGKTSRARRLATPKARRPRAADLAVPNRTRRAPHRKAPATRGHLIRTALRVPSRTGRLRFARPTKAQQARAKRTLWRRSKIAGRRALTAPYRGLKGLWAIKPRLRLWPVMPTPPLPEWRIPNIPDPAPRRRTKPAPPVPQLTGRRSAGVTQPKGTNKMSSPLEMIEEAFAQLTNFDPENGRAIEEFMNQLPQVLAAAGSSLSNFGQSLNSENPIHSSVGDTVTQSAGLLTGASEIASEANSTFLAVHADDLRRLNEPRAREDKWDVTQNQ